MSIKQQVGSVILNDFRQQNILRLQEWFTRFPEAPLLLEKELGGAALRYALTENMWLSASFLLRVPLLPHKGLQIQSAIENPHQVCPMLIQSHAHHVPSSMRELLSFLHDRVRM